ncbi:hypothetical protein [Escherichia phage vB-Eco-KMB37]|nr:hypothetical protein [Escherichia phage vB-Eco-KMB37]
MYTIPPLSHNKYTTVRSLNVLLTVNQVYSLDGVIWCREMVTIHPFYLFRVALIRLSYLCKFGQCGRTRTCDPKHPKLPRYQLRYAL